MAYSPRNPNGLAAAASSAPVVLASDQTQDYFITGAAAQSAAGNNVLLAAAGTAAIDTSANGNSYKSFYCQINGSAGIASGQIIFEGSNDNVNFVALTWFDDSILTAPLFNVAFSIAASTQKFFSGKISYRYLRCRIANAFVGGTVQAFVRLSTVDYAPRIQPVMQQQVTTSNFIATLMPRVLNGNSFFTGSIGAGANQVKASAGQVYGWHFHNPNAAVSYVQFFNTAVGSVTVGTTAPVLSVGIPANGTSFVEDTMGLAFSTAIVVACTTTRTGNTAPGSTVDLNIFYT